MHTLTFLTFSIMNSEFHFEKQPLLQLESIKQLENTYRPRHPHGWSRNLRPLHDVGELLQPEYLEAKPLYLEIGCGHGDFLVRQARRDPVGNYIGIEIVSFFAESAAKQAENQNLHNVLILNQNANDLMEQVLPDASVDKIFILYPDPWPKSRHRKRRLIRQETYALYDKVLKPGGEIEVWSDAQKWMELSAPFLKKLSGKLFQEEVSDEIATQRTLFERKARNKDHSIYHLVYTKSE